MSIPGGPVQEVSALNKLGSDGVVIPNCLELRIEGFRQELVLLDNLVEHFMYFNRRLQIALQHLKCRAKVLL